MKIIVNVKDINKAFKKLSPIVKPKPIMPVLEEVKLKFVEGKLYMVGSDVKNVISLSFDVKQEEVKEGYEFLMPFKLAKEFFALVEDETAAISVKDDFTEVSITTSKGKYKLGCENPSDYPYIDFEEMLEKKSEGFKLDRLILEEGIKKVLPFVEGDSIQGFDCVDVRVGDGKLNFVALSGHRVIMKSFDTDLDSSFAFKINKETAIILLGGLAEMNDEVVSVLLEDNKAHVMGEEDFISVSYTENKLPIGTVSEYLKVKDNMVNVTMRKDWLDSMVKMVSPYSDRDTKKIVLRFDGEKAFVKSKDMDYGKEAEVYENVIESSNVNVGFNSGYLKDCIRVLQEDDITMLIPKDNEGWCKEAVLIEEKENGIRMILLPLMPDEMDLAKAS